MAMQEPKHTGWIIAISEDVFSCGKSIVDSLAHRLGFRVVNESIVVERAAARGIEQKKLRALWTESHFLGRLSRSRYRHFCVLQAALAAEIRSGNVVCFGRASELLTVDAPGIIRVLITAPHASRVRMAADRLKIDQHEAEKLIARSDRKNQSWRRYILGAEAESRTHFDLIVNLEHMSIDDLCDAVGRLTLRPVGFEDGADVVEDFVLSTQIAATLALDPATCDLEMKLVAKGGSISVYGDIANPDQLTELTRIAQRSAVGHVDVSAVRIAPSDVAARIAPGGRSQRPVRALLALTAMGAAAALLFIGPWLTPRWLSPAHGPVQTFWGVVTDTLCPDRHQKPNDANCIRACVKNPGVHYALYDGSKSYVISDQGVAEALAAQKVVVTGTVDQKTGILQVDSIQPR